MGSINLIDQLRKRVGRGGSQTLSSFSPSKPSGSDDIQFEEESSFGDSGLDAEDKRRIAMLVLGIALVLGGRQAVPMYTQDVEASLRQNLASLDTKLAEEQKKSLGLKKIQEEMSQYDGRVADLKAKLQKVRLLEENRNLLVRMTDYIIKEMPQRLWFENLEVDTRTKVTISGYSTNYQIVSEFMKKLEGAVYFPTWKLVQTEAQGASSGSAESTASTSQSSTSTSATAVAIPPDSKKFSLEAETSKL